MRTRKAKTRALVEWRRPGDFDDAQRVAAIECPCGTGIQDSLHLFMCTHHAIVAVKERVIKSAEAWFTPERAPYDMFADLTNNACSKKKREEGREQHQQGVEAWNTATVREKLSITMGGDGTQLDTKMRTNIVTGCIKWWADIEDGWDEVNEGT